MAYLRRGRCILIHLKHELSGFELLLFKFWMNLISLCLMRDLINMDRTYGELINLNIRTIRLNEKLTNPNLRSVKLSGSLQTSDPDVNIC